MLKLNQVSLRRGTKLLFSDVQATIHQGQRVGVTGANGCGKSSLFSLFLGGLEPDSGNLELTAGLVFANTDQEVPASDRAAREYVIDGDRALRRIEQQLQKNDSVGAAGRGEHHAELLANYEEQGGYTANARAAALLNGLGFAETDQMRALKDFSGGWRMRLNLARALMCPSDVLLLDEPTNHLDLDAVLWLESWLLRYPGTLLLISHDREFLDRVCTAILHVEHQDMRLYSGNYTAFEQMRASQLVTQQAAYDRQQREIAHMQDFVRRFKAKATKARQAQSRVKALERMQLSAPAYAESEFRFQFQQPEKLPDPLLRLEGVSCGYSGTPVLEAVNCQIEPGERIGLLGMNGAGKSTFVRTLVGELTPLGGEILASPHLSVGYFAQHQLEQLPLESSVLSYMQTLYPAASEAELRKFVGGFGFHDDNVFAPVENFSGGEKARLVLAAIVYQRPNLLLLDEPTNHLDIEMRQALTMALQEFEGALILVSHDRHLLRYASDTLWLVNAGGVCEFEQELDAYADWLREQRMREAASNPGSSATNDHTRSAVARKEKKRQQAEQRKRLQPLRENARRLEQATEKTEQQLLQVEQALADENLYQDQHKSRLQTLLQIQAELRRQHEKLENEWLEALELLENAENTAI